MDAGTRRELLSDLGTGRIKVLTSCALIGEGVDVPSVGGCILLRPTASTSLHLQMIGRCLRPSPGKAAAVVLDHVGNTLRLGHHLEPREWTLEGIAKRDRENAPSVKVCPACFAAMASQARQCVECGHEFAPEVRELKQVEGELVEHSAFKVGDAVRFNSPMGSRQLWEDGHPWTVIAVLPGLKSVIIEREGKPAMTVRMSTVDTASMASSKARKRQQGTAQSLDDLRELAQQRGYKRGWAERVYQARLAKRYGI